jgi:predicted Fe-Mo cluster-binding NifX family protein
VISGSGTREIWAIFQNLMAGGMDWGAYEAMQGYGIEPIVTDMADIDKVVELYLAGRLPNLMGRLH